MILTVLRFRLLLKTKKSNYRVIRGSCRVFWAKRRKDFLIQFIGVNFDRVII